MKQKTKIRLKRIMLIAISIIAVLIATVMIFINRPNFGKISTGERLEQIKNSVNYKDGKFQNIHETPQLTSGKGYVMSMVGFIFKEKERLRPQTDLPIVKTNLLGHFSGRGLSPNQSLWSSFLLETPSRKIYIGGDSGYDTHYAEIGKRFSNIDLAILENGQYDKDWKYIHLLPEQVPQAFKELKAKRLFTVHHSKFALGNHPWDEPLKNISTFAERDSIDLIQPMIGEIVNLKDSVYNGRKWW